MNAVINMELKKIDKYRVATYFGYSGYFEVLKMSE